MITIESSSGGQQAATPPPAVYEIVTTSMPSTSTGQAATVSPPVPPFTSSQLTDYQQYTVLTAVTSEHAVTDVDFDADREQTVEAVTLFEGDEEDESGDENEEDMEEIVVNGELRVE